MKEEERKGSRSPHEDFKKIDTERRGRDRQESIITSWVFDHLPKFPGEKRKMPD